MAFVGGAEFLILNLQSYSRPSYRQQIQSYQNFVGKKRRSYDFGTNPDSPLPRETELCNEAARPIATPELYHFCARISMWGTKAPQPCCS